MRFVVTMIADIIIVDLPDHRAVRPAADPSVVIAPVEPGMVPAMVRWSVPVLNTIGAASGMMPPVRGIMVSGRFIPFLIMAALFGCGKRMACKYQN